MKKPFKFASAALLAAVFLSTADLKPIETAASEAPRAPSAKDEVVYANLTPTGEVKEIYVVNILSVDSEGVILDYGDYKSVKNLTNTEAIYQNGDQVTAYAPAGLFYYQGTAPSAQLPWNISVSYRLDGVERRPEELGGSSGHLEISLAVEPNRQADQTFVDNYTLQITVALGAAKCRNIEAPGCTLAYAGSDRVATYTVLPGRSGAATISADVADFAMKGIEIAALPLSIKLEAPDIGEMKSDLKSFSEAVSALSEGVGKLEDGARDLKKGLSGLYGGSAEFKGGLSELTASSGKLVSGSEEILKALSAISSSLSGEGGSFNAGALAKLPDGLSQLAGGLDGVSGGLGELKSALKSACSALDHAISNIPSDTISQEELAALIQSSPQNRALIEKLSEYYAAASATKSTYLAVKPAFDAALSSLDKLGGSVTEISSSLASISDQIRAAARGDEMLSQIARLSGALAELSENYASFHSGLCELAGGISQLSASYGSIHDGIAGLTAGAGSLSSGLSEAAKGAAEMGSAVRDMPEQVEDEVDRLLGQYDKSDFKPSSFVSPKNTGVRTVQFIIKTEEIKKPSAPVIEGGQAEKPGLIERLLDLFR